MVRNGRNVKLVTESESIASCIRHILVGSFHARVWKINQTKNPKATVESSVVTVNRTNYMCMGSDDSISMGSDIKLTLQPTDTDYYEVGRGTGADLALIANITFCPITCVLPRHER